MKQKYVIRKELGEEMMKETSHYVIQRQNLKVQNTKQVQI